MSGMPRLGSYELGEKIGMGATADVFKAVQPGVERSVAIKVMHPHIAGDADFSARFQREARAMGQLQHPHISRVIDFESSGAHPFMVMEFLAGGSLRDLIDAQTTRIPIDYSIAITRQLADALDYAHNMGMVHRDIKPANVMFTDAQARHAVLTDFGMARLADETMTVTGTILGTPAYMAPEQVRGEGAEAAADQYSLGVMLFELVTGQPPFMADSVHALMLKQATDEAPSPRSLNDQVSPALDAVISRAMAKHPADRFPSAGAMRDALDALGSSTGTSSARPATVVATTAQIAGEPAERPGGNSKLRLLLVSAGVVVLAGATIFGLSRMSGQDTVIGDDPIAAVGPTAATTPPAATNPVPSPDAAADPTNADNTTEALIDQSAGDNDSETSPEAPAGDTEQAGAPDQPDSVPSVAVPSFDISNPPALVPSVAHIDGEQLMAAFEHSREAAAANVYMVWLDNVAGPIGELVIDRAGEGQFTANVATVLSARSLTITEEPLGATPANPTGSVVFEQPLDVDSIERLDAGLAAVSDLEAQFAIARDHDGFIQDEIAANNLAEVRRHAEHVVNILDGETGASFGDLDGDGSAQNPGDGVGVRVYAEQVATALSAPGLDDFAVQVVGDVPIYSQIADGSSPAPFESYQANQPIDDLAEQVVEARSALEADVANALVFGNDYAEQHARGRGQVSLVAGGDTMVRWHTDTPGEVGRDSVDDALMRSVFGPELVELLGLQEQDAALLLEQVQIAIDHVALMQSEIDADNHGEVRRHAEHVINILEGNDGEHAGDLDGDGSAQNPGDGTGVLVYLDQVHTRVAAMTADTDAQALSQLAWITAVEQMRAGARTAVDAALRIIATDSSTEAAPTVRDVNDALVPVRDGFDADGNGVISLFAGELGAAELGFQAATLLTIPVLESEG